MKALKIITLSLSILVVFSAISWAQETEQDIINRYLNKDVKKQTERLGWASLHVGMNRINRHNDYNDFTIFESVNINGGELSWLSQAFSFGGEVGFLTAKRFTISAGGEYWLKLKDELSGTFQYLPTASNITNPSSEISVFGFYGGVGYYLLNPPSPKLVSQNLSVKVGGTVGFYQASWDLWDEYQNLNLSTSAPVSANTTFKGSAPGFTFDVTGEYPLQSLGLVMALNVNYLHLNFSNIAWYNGDEEVIVSLNGTPETRVDLALSGVRSKFEIKRYFNW